MHAKRTSIFLTPADHVAIRRLQTRYGLATMSDVIRFSLRMTENFLSGEGQRTIELLSSTARKRVPLPQQVQDILTRAKKRNQQVERRLSRNEEILSKSRGSARG
jgi:hypothetical protein